MANFSILSTERPPFVPACGEFFEFWDVEFDEVRESCDYTNFSIRHSFFVFPCFLQWWQTIILTFAVFVWTVVVLLNPVVAGCNCLDLQYLAQCLPFPQRKQGVVAFFPVSVYYCFQKIVWIPRKNSSLSLLHVRLVLIFPVLTNFVLSWSLLVFKALQLILGSSDPLCCSLRRWLLSPIFHSSLVLRNSSSL